MPTPTGYVAFCGKYEVCGEMDCIDVDGSIIGTRCRKEEEEPRGKENGLCSLRAGLDLDGAVVIPCGDRVVGRRKKTKRIEIIIGSNHRRKRMAEEGFAFAFAFALHFRPIGLYREDDMYCYVTIFSWEMDPSRGDGWQWPQPVSFAHLIRPASPRLTIYFSSLPSQTPSLLFLPSQHQPTTTNNNQQLVDLLSDRVPPGVDEAAYPKAAYLSALALGEEAPTLISRARAIELLGTMQGGYNGRYCAVYWVVYDYMLPVCVSGTSNGDFNSPSLHSHITSSISSAAVATLIALLSDSDESMAKLAGDQLKHTLLVFDAFHDVEELHKAGNAVATEVLESWASAEWYTSKAEVPDKITVTVFKGECMDSLVSSILLLN